MPAFNNVTTVHLENTVASRGYPFTQMTLDQIQDLRKHYEEKLEEAHGSKHMVPAPVILADAVNELWKSLIK